MRTYFGATTAQQRRPLFERYEASGNREEACQRAGVSQSTFYVWKARFEAEGYAGLEKSQSRAPHQPHRIARGIEERVIELYKQHGEWGKERIADEMAKANNWVPQVSANTVRRILQDAGLWSTNERAVKKGG